jgi:prepilin-type processing-associated H-X9-DG protein
MRSTLTYYRALLLWLMSRMAQAIPLHLLSVMQLLAANTFIITLCLKMEHEFPANLCVLIGLFADYVFGDVLPVTTIQNGIVVTEPSQPGLTFQNAPDPRDFSPFTLSSHQPGGINVAMFDGSVRFVTSGISTRAFWSQVTHNGLDSAHD